jgi:hypothetical protein
MFAYAKAVNPRKEAGGIRFYELDRALPGARLLGGRFGARFHPQPTDSQRVSKNPLTSQAYTVEVDLCRPATRSTSFG